MRWVTARRLFLLAVLVVAALVFMRVTVPENVRPMPLESGLRGVIAPVQSGFTWLGRQASNLFSLPVSMYVAGKRNQVLEAEVASLESQIIQLNEFKLENERLTALLDYKQVMATAYDLIAASVIGRDSGNWFGTITLNRGSNDGIKENMTVLVPEGLVGRVFFVSSTTCEVLLITDPRSGVGALIQDTRTTGIVEGTIASSGIIRMIHIPNSDPVEAGQVVITSGSGSIFPKNISIGKITDIRKEPSGLFNSADIKPFVDLSRLEEVLIIINTYP